MKKIYMAGLPFISLKIIFEFLTAWFAPILCFTVEEAWLSDNFIGEKSPDGKVIAKFSNYRDVLENYKKWEVHNPGTSSFNYSGFTDKENISEYLSYASLKLSL